MSFVLLLGLIALFGAHVRTLGRVKRLEQRIDLLVRRPDSGRSEALPEDEPSGVEAGEPEGPPVRETAAGLFERFVGGRLLIWIGGIAIAVAGMFLVRHSIDLVTPEARMIAAALLGIALIGAGEYARAGRLLADDPRIGQALVGAGVVTLYAAAYGSHLLFGLIGSGTAAALMLLITVAALALSLRHGAPAAAMGLVGGFSTPMLVGDADAGALPVLFYIALLDVAIFAIAWRRKWIWLAPAAVLLSFAWTGYFTLERVEDALAAGMFAALLGVTASLPRSEERRSVSLVQPAIIALLQTSVLVVRGDLDLPAWLLFGAVAAATVPLAMLRPEQRFAPPAALLLALLLIAIKAEGPDPILPWAAAAATLVFGGAALLPRGERPVSALTAAAALAGPLLILRLLRPELLSHTAWGLTALGLALAAFGLLRILRARPASGHATQVAAFGAALTGALLLGFAGYDLTARDFVSGSWLAAAIGLLFAGMRLHDKALRLAGLVALTVTTLKVFLIDADELEGVLRILSFLALGGALIGIGKLYSKVLSGERKGAAAPEQR
jgi:uncharacterized membrane protein